MMIIDAHLHLSDHEYMTRSAREAGHENAPEHLARVFADEGIGAAVAMGGDGLGLAAAGVRVFYCASVRGEKLDTDAAAELERAEKCLAEPDCAGLKLYPGYDYRYPADKDFLPFYELAGGYGKPIVFHTGDTAGDRGLVKYAHPLGVDEVAVKFRNTRFVLAHCGNPWIADAVEIAAKNDNAALDLSGLAVGNFDADELYSRCEAYWKYLRMWIEYLADDSKIMYGSDWPLVNVHAYLKLLRRVVPERMHEAFFSGAARRIFRLPELAPQDK
ncbi:MAG: amidohydrolase family protein [Lentisphaeria bacterium]|nr:amidohydrolase family protein [Lentisphaeria bacterium]